MLLGLVVAVIVSLVLIVSSSDNTGPLQQRLSARQTTTLKITEDSRENITDDEIAKFNSELNIVLMSDDAVVQGALKGAGMKKVDKETAAAEADTATFEKLQTAKINGQYDRTYRVVIEQKLESLRSLLQELHGSTKDKALKSALASEYEHLGFYLDALTKLPR